jgi:hypothetical protein
VCHNVLYGPQFLTAGAPEFIGIKMMV